MPVVFIEKPDCVRIVDQVRVAREVAAPFVAEPVTVAAAAAVDKLLALLGHWVVEVLDRLASARPRLWDHPAALLSLVEERAIDAWINPGLRKKMLWVNCQKYFWR